MWIRCVCPWLASHPALLSPKRGWVEASAWYGTVPFMKHKLIILEDPICIAITVFSVCLDCDIEFHTNFINWYNIAYYSQCSTTLLMHKSCRFVVMFQIWNTYALLINNDTLYKVFGTTIVWPLEIAYSYLHVYLLLPALSILTK